MTDYRPSQRLLQIRHLVESGNLPPGEAIKLNAEISKIEINKIADILELRRIQPKLTELALRAEGALEALTLISAKRDSRVRSNQF